MLSKGAGFPPLLKKRLGTESMSEEEECSGSIYSYCRKVARKETWKRCVWQFRETDMKAFYFGIEMLGVGKQECTVHPGSHVHPAMF